MRLITIQNKIIVVVIVIVFSFAPFLFYFYPNQQKNILTEGYKKEVSNIATTVGLGVNIALEEQNFAGVETAMSFAKSDERLNFVALIQIDSIENSKGEKIAEKSIFTVFPENYKLDIDIESSEEMVVSDSPILTEMLNGSVLVGFSTDSIHQTISEMRFTSIISSLIVSLFGVLLGLWLARNISKPVLLLREAAAKVESGDLDQALTLKSKDEIGDLFIAFNSMVSQLNVTTNELVEQKDLVEEKNKSMTDSISYAKRIQEAILPSIDSISESFNDSFVMYMPKDIVSGDFYWLEKSNDITLISVADCTGHGVPGAFVSLVSSNALNSSVKEHKLTEPAAILNQTNTIIRSHFEQENSQVEVRDGMDISLCKIKRNELKIEFAGALNPLWVISKSKVIDNGKNVEANLVDEDSNFYEIKGDKQPIGRYIEQKPYLNHEVELNTGDVIYLISDGFADQFGGEKGKKFKYKTFKKLLLSIWELPLQEQNQILKKTIIDWMGDIEQLDDICIIGIRI